MSLQREEGGDQVLEGKGRLCGAAGINPSAPVVVKEAGVCLQLLREGQLDRREDLSCLSSYTILVWRRETSSVFLIDLWDPTSCLHPNSLPSQRPPAFQ